MVEGLGVRVVRRLQGAGFVAYFAGGCVRDWVMGREPKDVDVATSAVPEEVAGLFARSQMVGAAFGVVLVKEKKEQVEVATFRADGTYTDGRHPDAVRFTTAAALVNELVEAHQQLQLRRVLARWARYDVIALGEVGYVPLAEVGAEFVFQVIAERAERATVLLTTNLPFSEWTQVIPNARLCKALLDRITDRAHIIETGTESYRFRRTLERRRRKEGPSDPA